VREELVRVRTDLARLEQSIQRVQAEIKTDVQRSERQTAQTLAEVQRGVAEVAARFDEQGRETAQLHGRLDDLRRRLDAVALQLEVVGSPRPPHPADPAPNPPPPERPAEPPRVLTPPAPLRATAEAGSPGSPATAAPAREAVDLYQTAYIDYTKGNYQLAIAGFRELLRRYPRIELAEKAQYWIGESHFSQARTHQARGEAEAATREFERASQEFRRVLIEHPQGTSVPSALLKRAFALVELKQHALAEADLRYLVDQFPSREEAQRAREELARLRR
jgi:TolA-binding protein